METPGIHILGISGSPIPRGNTETLLEEALKVAESHADLQIEIIHLSSREISDCRHCNWCTKNQTPETFCAISDGMDEIYAAMVRADAILLATPVHIGRMSGRMANMLDRMRVFAYGRIHRGRLKDKVGGAMVIGFWRHGGLETTLQILEQSFALFHMIPIGQGGLALSSLDGKGKVLKGVQHMVMEDTFGIASAREVVQRTIEIATILQAGKIALNRVARRKGKKERRMAQGSRAKEQRKP